MTRPEIPIRMAHVALTATFEQFDSVSTFYRDVFGWRVERELNGTFGRHQFLTDDHGCHIELIARSEVVRGPRTPEPPGHICFAVPDEQFDDVLHRVRDAGVDVGEPSVSTPQTRNETDARGAARTGTGVSRHVFIDDPSGNCVEISTGAYRSLTQAD